MNPTQSPKDTQSARFSPGIRSISCVPAVKSIVLFLTVLLFFASGAWAMPTTEDDARNAAVNWLSQEAQPMGSPMGRHVKNVQTFADETGAPAYYVVYLQPSGLIFLPADDQVDPIIGFVSDATSYDPSSDNPLGALVNRDIPGRVARVRGTETADAPMAKAKNKWNRLAGLVSSSEGAGADSPLSSVSDVRVAPFVQSRWDQAGADGSNPNPTCNFPCYNYYNPPYGSGNPANNYVCGCTATAMAQVIRYFQYPSAGIGVVSGKYSVGGGPQQTGKTLGGNGKGGAYDWKKMPLTTSSSTPLDQRQAIGRLTWDAGLALDTDYDSVANDGSSSGWDNVPNAFLSFFHYSNAIHGDNHGNNLPEADLYAMVNPNLHAKYPVILGINGPNGGHEIVCDGYGYNGSTIYHHLNMGWSGSDDAWYNLPTIDAVANDYLFTSIHTCNYNIYTSGSGEIIAGRVTDAVGNPISGAQVERKGLSGSKHFTTTDAKGIYAFTQVPSNSTYNVTVAKTGYTFIFWPVLTGASTDGDVSTVGTGTGNVWGVDFAAMVFPPTAPTGVKATAGNAQATVSFKVPASNGGCPITGYAVTSSPGGKTGTGKSSPITVQGLTNGTIYTFTVTAANALSLNSPPSSPSNKVKPVGPPGAPTNVKATAGNAQAKVSFTAPVSNGGSPINTYWVYPDPSVPNVVGFMGAHSPITVTRLTNGVAYTFTVNAVNGVGTSSESLPSPPVTPQP